MIIKLAAASVGVMRDVQHQLSNAVSKDAGDHYGKLVSSTFMLKGAKRAQALATTNPFTSHAPSTSDISAISAKMKEHAANLNTVLKNNKAIGA
jgi:hypothetical protein